MRMNFCRIEIVKSLPGRLRVKIKGLRNNRYFAEAIENTLRANEKVFAVTANPQTGNALILFDSRKICADKFYKEILDSIDCMILRLVSSRTAKSYRKNLDSKTEETKVFDPEDLPIQSQVSKVTLSGGLLLFLTLKRLFWGKSVISRSSAISNLAALTTIVTGYPIFRSGLESLVKRRKLNNDFLISAATVVSLLLKESITGLVVVWLVNLSTLFQTMTLDKSRKAIKEMLQGKDETAWLVVDGTEISVPIESIEKDDVVIVYVGQKIPIDGEVISGEAAVSQAIITGEAIPITKKQGDKVFAGSIVEQGTIRVLAEKVGKETSIARIVQLVDEASKVRAPIENIADRYSEKIVPLSLGLAALNYIITRDFKRSMTMLIVACPCAAGLATPTAIGASMGNAAKQGILIKGGNYLEKVGKTNVVLFDKTGTLTEGSPSVVTIESVHKEYSPDTVLQLTASVENYTNHPLAKAVLEKANEKSITTVPVDAQKVIIGQGVKGIINKDLVIVGNELLMDKSGISINKGRVKAERIKLLGQTVLFTAYKSELIGIIGIKDKVRCESSRAIKGLREEGICNIGLITGDCTEAGELIKDELGLDNMWANTLPEEKVNIVEKYQSEGKLVTMVGEGINDSPALAKADVGIAMGTGGTDIAIESADIVLADDNPEKIVNLVKLSNHTMEVVKQNFIFAVGINALGLILGAGKIISPLAAAILHNLSTFGVVVNSSRLINYSTYRKKRRRTGGRTKRLGK